ncbi:hypothetical protein [Comamonas thiooxydans]|uniref:hypothetical protein n=1 Tax=Comamonas thiooxydans TaxID=363952 RepID=UPI000A728F13|nr:hypothetical protein [Comamonas thiooxydans]
MFQTQTFQGAQRNYLATHVTGDAYTRSIEREPSTTLDSSNIKFLIKTYSAKEQDYYATAIRQVDGITGLIGDAVYSSALQIKNNIAPLKSQAKIAFLKRVKNFYYLKDTLISRRGTFRSGSPYAEFEPAVIHDPMDGGVTYNFEASCPEFEAYKAYEAYENLLSKFGVASSGDHFLIGGAQAEEKASDQLRLTTEHEHAIAELRQWAELQANWDGEEADAPRRESLEAASKFICLIMWSFKAPEPMLHANGRAGLLWDEDDFYGEIEFLDSSNLAYYFKNQQGKHKGEVIFEGNVIPDALKVLIPEENAD